jgi:hypothetical protein
MSFDLQSISKTRRVRAPKIVIVGQGKIGKTTFAAMSPNAIGILTEDGADAVDANAFPLATNLADVYAAIETLIVCSGFGLGARLLTGATLAGGFFDVTIFKPIYLVCGL